MKTHTHDVVGYASENKAELDRGVLLTPDNTIDTTTGTIKLKATFTNAHRKLWPGQFVNAALLVGTEPNVIAIAATSVQHGPDGLYVYQVGQNATVAVQPIQVARQEGAVSVVSSGLADGAVVVSTAQSRLQNVAHVTVREAQTPPAAAVQTAPAASVQTAPAASVKS